jgi:hypothetical protein
MAAAMAAAKTTTMKGANPAAEALPTEVVCGEAASRAEIIPARFTEAACHGLAVERLY